jgi:predicted metal-dependent enzyme (double-stranded beta helix superfamily)
MPAEFLKILNVMKTSDKLSVLIDKIQNTETPDNKKLVNIIKQVNIRQQDVEQYAQYKHPKQESYGRCEIYKTDNFGIYAMSWNPGDFTAIHSHGHSEWGAVFFLGNANHRLYSVEGKFIDLVLSETIRKGSIAPVCGKMIHAMGNLSDKAFMTLHIYGSNSYKGNITEDSEIFEIEKERIRTTTGPAFIDMSDEYCKSVETGLKTNSKTARDYNTITQKFHARNRIHNTKTL